MSKFDDIRPYNDAEVRPTLDKIIQDPELIEAIAAFRFPRLKQVFGFILRPLIKAVLKRRLAKVDGVEPLQVEIKAYMDRMIAETSRGLTFSGLDKLQPNKAYLFISNHRDIAMDPAFVSMALFDQGFSTVRIAIGDNLLTKPYVSDLMRLNKSFIVNRSATAPREKLRAAKHLSSYIHHSINEENANIWIAHREGRAKDGMDITNPAIISMIALSKGKQRSLGEYINELHIVPVAISYELDPCDSAKTNELYQQGQNGGYQKDEHEDIDSIALGISGEKGRVHVAFGEVLRGDFENTDDVAAEIDRQIRFEYRLHPSNCFAYHKLKGQWPQVKVGSEGWDFKADNFGPEGREFEARLAQVPEAQREIFLAMYANPVINKLSR
ncbi:MAG: 1-acyl-sn-glycerol-3-phosphate acyltransferase [Cellvibrionaceae bacterium]|nr:1-acyl-sn-glycerol-3-phosphate acyltransferase [Cellvibrionaceae bacterium]